MAACLPRTPLSGVSFLSKRPSFPLPLPLSPALSRSLSLQLTLSLSLSCPVRCDAELDAALQYFVATRSGLPLQTVSVVHLNRNYERRGTLELDRLFAESDVTAAVLQLQGNVEQQLAGFKKVS